MRQVTDSAFVDLLNRARLGILQKDDINLLKSLAVCQDLPRFLNSSSSLHLFPKLKDVKQLNDQVQSSMKTADVVIPASHFFSMNDVAPHEEFHEKYIPVDDRNAGGMPNTLRLSKGSRVMLLRNIYTKQGLVNGALGRVQHIEFSNISDTKGMKYPAKIYILFDNSSIGCILQDPMYHNAIPIEQCDQEYFYKGRSVIRRQFPLTLAWAISIHKSQGATLNSIYCDIGTNILSMAWHM